MIAAAEARTIDMIVNGQPRHGVAEPRLTLADFLRHRLGLTGTHLGCEHGICGACTVTVDGVAVRGCLMLAIQAQGRQVETVEGLEKDGVLHPLQQAFVKHHGLQCEFCTPGILMTLIDFLRDTPDPSETEMREALSGNICRCTGYQNIIIAALAAAKAMRDGGTPA